MDLSFDVCISALHARSKRTVAGMLVDVRAGRGMPMAGEGQRHAHGEVGQRHVHEQIGAQFFF